MLHENISKNEAELHKDRELFKNLNNHHNALKKQLEHLTRERDDNELHIRNLKDKELSLHNKLKSVTDELARSDGTNIKTELKSHVESRKKHLDEVKGILDLLSNNLSKISKEEE
jgi:predicted  nucleic acid-binding Zn-ribbon protein